MNKLSMFECINDFGTEQMKHESNQILNKINEKYIVRENVTQDQSLSKYPPKKHKTENLN